MTNKVAIITGFYQSPHFLIELFQHLNKQSYRNFDVYVYNYDLEAIAELKAFDLFFDYKILKLEANAGFAGGNNFAIQEAKKNFDYSFYALVNDDTKPHEHWLKSLLETALADPSIGAVTSKMVYYEPFLLIKGNTQIVKKDSRRLGLRLYTNTSFEDCAYKKKFYYKGFYKEEEDEIYTFRWTDSSFTLALPVTISDDKPFYTLRLFVQKNARIKEQELVLCIGGVEIGTIRLEDKKVFYEIDVSAPVVLKNMQYIIQNAGSNYDKKFNGYDIGSGEVDKGQYDEMKEVAMFCGGASLLSKTALLSTGLFNSHYFSYYEDSDLSVRLKQKGFRIVYDPNALVFHYHSGTSKEWSPFFTYHVFRNKIIFSGRNFGFKAFISSYRERAKETWMFLKWAGKNRFHDAHLRARLKLNVRILIDAVIGILKYKPAKF